MDIVINDDSGELIDGTVDLINRFKPKPGFTSITGRALPPVKVFINMCDRTVNADQVSRYLRSESDGQIDGYVTVLNTITPQLKIYTEAAGKREPLHIKVRLAEIDTPEKKQYWGQNSKQALSELIFSLRVTVDST